MKTSEFICKLNNPALGRKMSEAKSAEEAYTVAKTADVTDSLEEFMAEIEKIKASDGELSEDNLASVAGGYPGGLGIDITSWFKPGADIDKMLELIQSRNYDELRQWVIGPL